MKALRHTLAGFGTIAVLAVLITAFAPKTLHAVVATLVQVANTTSSPAITSGMDNPGRVPFQFSVEFPALGPSLAYTFEDGPPTGHRLVIERVSVSAKPTTASTLSVVMQVKSNTATRVTSSSTNSNDAYISMTANAASPNGYSFDRSVLVFLDPGYKVFLTPQVSSGNLGAVTFTLSGYMLDCTAAPCSAVQPVL